MFQVSCVMCHVSCVICHVSCVMSDVSCATVTRHMSCVMCHMLHVTCHMSLTPTCWFAKTQNIFVSGVILHLSEPKLRIQRLIYLHHFSLRNIFVIIFCPRTFVNGNNKKLKKYMYKGTTHNISRILQFID